MRQKEPAREPDMNLTRVAMIVAGAGACAAWLSAAMTPARSRPIASATSVVAPVETSGAELASEIARLRDRLRPDAAPRQPGRNLFSFRAAAAPSVTPNAALPEAPVQPALAEPEMKLVGLAEDSGPDDPIRTAIISSPGGLFLVKEGESVTALYRVARIFVDVVELIDIRNGATRQLALK